VDMYATDLIGINYITRVLLVYICQQGVYPRGHVLLLRLPCVTNTVLKEPKAKAIPLHATEALGGERRYSSYSFPTSALDGGEWSASRPGRALAPGIGPPVPIVQEAGRAPEPVWTQRLEEKFFRLCRGSNLDHPVVQPVVRHYTD
jgi:hypothetical protein